MLPFIRTLRSKGLIKAVFEFGNHCRLNLYSTCCRFLPHALRMICLVICRPCSAGVPLETPPIRFAPWVVISNENTLDICRRRSLYYVETTREGCKETQIESRPLPSWLIGNDGFSHLMGMNEREAAQWLHDLTHEFCWGIKVIDRKTGKPHPAYANTNRKLERLAARRFVKLQLLTQKRLLAHFSGEETLYFTGSPGDHTLVMIDIDCHSRGNLKGALQFAEYLRENSFPGLYFEPSTNGNGVHGYLVVAKSDDKECNRAAKALDRWLKAVLSATTFDVEDVEIKGTCSIWERGNVTEGTLAKYPRDVSRFKDWKRTASFSVEDILSLIEASPIRPMTKKEAETFGQHCGEAHREGDDHRPPVLWDGRAWPGAGVHRVQEPGCRHGRGCGRTCNPAEVLP